MGFIKRLSFLFIGTLLLAAVQTGTDVCPTVVQTALENANRQCAEIGRNQVCYGNFSLQASPQADTANFELNQPGDIEDVAAVRSLRLSAFDQDLGQWGIALMRIQANVPDTLPGQNVTLLLFGDVELTNAVAKESAAVTLDTSANIALNIRLLPSLRTTVLQSIRRGTPLQVDGRLADNSWLRVYLPDQGRHGWVQAGLLSTDADIQTLPAIDPTQPVFGSMQAFYFRAGFRQPTCENVPDSGILIQSPAGFGRITLSVNEALIQFEGTSFLQAQPGDHMEVSVLDGSAQISAQDTIRFVPAGAAASVPMTDDLSPAGPPERPQPYENAQVMALPVSELEQPVEVQPALTIQELYPPTATAVPVVKSPNPPVQSNSGSSHIVPPPTIFVCPTYCVTAPPAITAPPVPPTPFPTPMPPTLGPPPVPPPQPTPT